MTTGKASFAIALSAVVLLGSGSDDKRSSRLEARLSGVLETPASISSQGSDK